MGPRRSTPFSANSFRAVRRRFSGCRRRSARRGKAHSPRRAYGRPHAGARFLFFAAEAGIAAGVEHLACCPAPPSRHRNRAPAGDWAGGKTGRFGRWRAFFQRAVFGLPFGQAAIQHRNLVMAHGAQHPPDAGGGKQSGPVIDHHHVAIADSQRAEVAGEILPASASCAAGRWHDRTARPGHRTPRREYARPRTSPLASRLSAGMYQEASTSALRPDGRPAIRWKPDCSLLMLMSQREPDGRALFRQPGRRGQALARAGIPD
jgi:hypothetical protein